MAAPTAYVNNWTDETLQGAVNALITASATFTAHSGGGKTSAIALTSIVNYLGTVAASGDSALLPAAVAPLQVTVVNQGTFPAQLFAAGTDTINSITNAAGIWLGVGASAVFSCTTTGNWLVPQSSLFGSGQCVITGDATINAHAGQTYILTKGSAAALTLGAPTATTDDGIQIVFSSGSAFAHVITSTGNINTGGTATGVLTAAAHAGCSVTLEAYQAKWNIVSNNLFALTS